MSTITLSDSTLWLIGAAVGANLVFGISHLLIVLEAIRDAKNIPLFYTLLWGVAYATPVALIVLSVAKVNNII
jgi:hypothetical protein